MDINMIRNRPQQLQAIAQAFGVNLDTNEVIKWSLYDSNPYPAVGLNVATFFALPIGQGTGFGGGVKTLSDTNMQNQGSLPANQNFAITDIEILFQPTTPTVAAAMPSVFGAEAALVQINDAYIFRRSGNFQLLIGQKPYLWEAPLWNMPPKVNFRIDSSVADQSTIAGNLQTRNGFADVDGPVYTLGSTPILLTPNQNFQVTLNWPEGLQAITNPARIFVRLNGWLYRPAQ